MGSIPPITAAEIAKQFGVRVYTVGLGTNGSAPYPFKDQFGNTHYQMIPVDIDEGTLGKIASITGGKYFRARNNTDLSEIYQQIDKLEKVKIAVTRYHKRTEHYLPFAIIALFFLSLEILLNNTIFKGALT
jgi:Ca-activated chloride channel family protein